VRARARRRGGRSSRATLPRSRLPLPLPLPDYGRSSSKPSSSSRASPYRSWMHPQFREPRHCVLDSGDSVAPPYSVGQLQEKIQRRERLNRHVGEKRLVSVKGGLLVTATL